MLNWFLEGTLINLSLGYFKFNSLVLVFHSYTVKCCYLCNIFHSDFNPEFALPCKCAPSSEPQEPLELSLDRSLLCWSPILFFILCCHNPPLLPWFTLGRWLGFGFITFEAEQSVDQAVNMHFHDIMGKKVCSCSFILPIISNRGLGDWVALLLWCWLIS